MVYMLRESRIKEDSNRINLDCQFRRAPLSVGYGRILRSVLPIG
jgi:hypothetical protein